MIAPASSFSHPDAQLTLRQAWEKYHRSPDQSARYQQNMRTTLSHWERCTDNPPIGEIDNAVMARFRAAFLSSPLPSRGQLPSPATYNKTAAEIGAVMSLLGPQAWRNPYALGVIDNYARAKPAEVPEPDVVVATEAEVSLIYDHCHLAHKPLVDKTGIRPCDLFRALVVFLYNVGTRRNDFKSLRQDQVDFDRKVVFVRIGKSKKFRALPMNQVVISHLRRIWSPRRELVFPFPDHNADLYSTWRMIQRAAGIHVPRPERIKRHTVYGFHELRKTCLTEIAGVNETAAQQMGAHGKLLTTMRHYLSAQRKEGIVRQASERIAQPAAFLKLRSS